MSETMEVLQLEPSAAVTWELTASPSRGWSGDGLHRASAGEHPLGQGLPDFFF